jgi:hypothetical protein
MGEGRAIGAARQGEIWKRSDQRAILVGDPVEKFEEPGKRNELDYHARLTGAATDWLLILAGKLDERLGPAWAEDVDMPPWRL